MFDPLLAFIRLIERWHVIFFIGFAAIFSLWMYFDTSGDVTSAVRLQRSLHAIVMIPVMIILLAFMVFIFRHNEFGAAASFPSLLLVWSTFAILGVIGFGIGDPDFPYLLVGTMALVGSIIMSGMICGRLALIR